MRNVTTTTARLIRNEATAFASKSWVRPIGLLSRMARVRSDRSPAISSEASHPKIRMMRNITMPPMANRAATVIEYDWRGAMLLSSRYWSSAIRCLTWVMALSMLNGPLDGPPLPCCLACSMKPSCCW